MGLRYGETRPIENTSMRFVPPEGAPTPVGPPAPAQQVAAAQPARPAPAPAGSAQSPGAAAPVQKPKYNSIADLRAAYQEEQKKEDRREVAKETLSLLGDSKNLKAIHRMVTTDVTTDLKPIKDLAKKQYQEQKKNIGVEERTRGTETMNISDDEYNAVMERVEIGTPGMQKQRKHLEETKGAILKMYQGTTDFPIQKAAGMIGSLFDNWDNKSNFDAVMKFAPEDDRKTLLDLMNIVKEGEKAYAQNELKFMDTMLGDKLSRDLFLKMGAAQTVGQGDRPGTSTTTNSEGLTKAGAKDLKDYTKDPAAKLGIYTQLKSLGDIMQRYPDDIPGIGFIEGNAGDFGQEFAGATGMQSEKRMNDGLLVNQARKNLQAEILRAYSGKTATEQEARRYAQILGTSTNEVVIRNAYNQLKKLIPMIEREKIAGLDVGAQEKIKNTKDILSPDKFEEDVPDINEGVPSTKKDRGIHITPRSDGEIEAELKSIRKK